MKPIEPPGDAASKGASVCKATTHAGGEEPRTIGAMIRGIAGTAPDNPAILAPGREPLSYAALAGQLDYVQQTLNGWGIGRGDRVAMAVPERPETAVAFVSIAACAGCAPLIPSLTAGEFETVLSDLGIDALVVPAGAGTPARSVAARLGIAVIELVAQPDRPAGLFVLQGGKPATAERPGSAGPDDVALVLHTSGTTSKAKIVPRRHRNLTAMAYMLNRWFRLTADDRSLHVMPLYHGHALNSSLVIPLAAGSSIAIPPPFDADEFFEYLDEFKPTWYSAGYTFHQAILARAPYHKETVARCNLRFIRSGSGRLPPEVMLGLEETFGAPVAERYGSTEAGGTVTANPLPPGRRKPGSVGIPVGQEVAIIDEAGAILPQGETGEIVVRGPGVFDGYENDPEANAEAFIDGWFRLGDLGRFDADGYLTITGRVKDIINRGGQKISPFEVEQALSNHPAVESALAFAMPHQTLGEDVAAAVILRDAAAATELELRRHVHDRLADFKVPRKIAFVDGFPHGPTGKIARARMAEQLGLDRTERRDAPGPADRRPSPLEATLCGIWAKTLGCEEVGLDDDFFSLGGDSLQAVNLFLEIETALGQRLPRAILFEAGTVAEMARLIAAESPSKCVVPIQPEGDRPPFFCVHDSNGHVLNYRDLARRLGKTQPFFGIQCLGLDGNDVPFRYMEEMAAHYIGEIRTVQPMGPYYLGGYSFGGRVAHVMAQQLRDAGEDVALLALIDSFAHVGRKRIGLRQWLVRNRQWFAGMSLIELLAYVAFRIRRAAVVIALVLRHKLFAAAWRCFETRGRPIPRFLRRPADANAMINATYRARHYDGGAVLFKAELNEWQHADKHDGWHDLVKGGLEIRAIAGRHFDIVREPHVRELAKELDACLAEARARASAPNSDSSATA